MVTYCVTKIIPTCPPVIRQFFDTMIVASIDYRPTCDVVTQKSGYNDTSKSKSWNVWKATLTVVT